MYEEALGETREYISRILHEFESIMELHDERKVKEAAEALKHNLDISRGGFNTNGQVEHSGN
jgi:RNase H-fold protein (predicted Holliday junction resolvase)